MSGSRTAISAIRFLNPQGSEIWITDQNNRKLPAIIGLTEIETRGTIRLTLKITGHFDTEKKVLFSARLHFYAGTAKTCLELTIHNPHAAKHPGGIWDLGDPASFLFKELIVSLSLNEANKLEKRFKLTPDDSWQNCNKSTGLKIYQESSGGENWDSPNHRNRDGLVPMTMRGYHVLQDDAKVIAKGDRSQPIIWAGSGTTGLSLVMPKFWQEFPKALEVNTQTLDISLYPGFFPDFYELQGGEQKTHAVYFDFAAHPDQAGWGVRPLHITLDPQTMNDSSVLEDVTCG